MIAQQLIPPEVFRRKAELAAKIRDFEPSTAKYRFFRLKNQFLPDNQDRREERSAWAYKFAAHFLEQAQEHLKAADENQTYIASFTHIIYHDGGFWDVKKAADYMGRSLRCYHDCAEDDKGKLKHDMEYALDCIVRRLVFADRALGEFDYGNRRYVLRDSVGPYFKAAAWFARKQGEFSAENSQAVEEISRKILYYRVYQYFFENNPYLSDKLRLKLHLEAYEVAPGEKERNWELKCLGVETDGNKKMGGDS